MANEFAVSFFLKVETLDNQQSPSIEVEDCKYLELPRKEGPDVADACEAWEILQNINCDKRVEALESGEYDCLMAGSWDYDVSHDWEGNVDAELIIEIEYFKIQKHVEIDDGLITEGECDRCGRSITPELRGRECHLKPRIYHTDHCWGEHLGECIEED